MGFSNNYINASANKTSSGLGSLLGLGLGMAANTAMPGGGSALGNVLSKFAGGGPANPQEGGHVPMEASPSGGKAIDDVPARLSPGEFVIPADVVKWYGEKHMYGLIDKSKREREETEANTTAKPDMMAAIPSPPKFVSQSSAIPA